jgi:hypothetical protein
LRIDERDAIALKLESGCKVVGTENAAVQRGKPSDMLEPHVGHSQ